MRPPDDVPSRCSVRPSRTPISVDGSATGDIGHPGDRDWFAVELEASATYQFDSAGAHRDWTGTYTLYITETEP